MARSFYDLLGVAPDAAAAAIDAAYRERSAALAKSDTEPAAQARTRLDAAYRILRNAKTRAEYDRRLHAAQGGAAPTSIGAATPASALASESASTRSTEKSSLTA